MFQAIKLWAIVLVTLCAASAYGQIRVGLDGQRDTFLQFEPIVFRVKLQNTSTSPVTLQDHPVSGRPWLAFQIFKANGEKVRAVEGYSVPSQVLRPGESTAIEVNITQLYSVRETGPYDLSAVVSIAGGRSFVTGKIRFYVGKGEEVWLKEFPVGEGKRTYSLIRFLENRESALYVRVEEPAKNLVYTTSRLGSVVGYTSPDVKRDPAGRLHILHVNTSQMHRYSVISPDGLLLEQEDRVDEGGAPRLIANESGTVKHAGGVDIRSKPKRRKLSEDQAGL